MSVPLCGYTLAWNSPGHPDQGRRFTFTPRSLDRWLRSGMGVPVRVDHRGIATSRGITGTVGAARRFRADAYGCLALLDLDDQHEWIADGVRRGWCTGLSGAYDLDATDPPDHQPHPIPLVRALVVRDITVLDATLTEVSLTEQPSDPRCRVLGVGDDALKLWNYEHLDQVTLASV